MLLDHGPTSMTSILTDYYKIDAAALDVLYGSRGSLATLVFSSPLFLGASEGQEERESAWWRWFALYDRDSRHEVA